MRKTEIINQEIGDLDKIIENGTSLLVKFPNDNLIPLSIQQAKYRKQLLIEERQGNSSSSPKSFLAILSLLFASIFKKNHTKENA